METTFQYRRLGPAFANELSELVSSGQSTVLLGLRDIGKRYALKQLATALGQDKALVVVSVEFPHAPALLERRQIQQLVRDAVDDAAVACEVGRRTTDDGLLDSLKRVCLQQPRRVALLAANVDSLSHHLAQAFLREIRTLVNDSRIALTAVLTGEENLCELVYGPESEFNCAHQFVLQGFEEAEYFDYLARRRETDRIPFADHAACQKLLFIHTRGNAHIARAVLWASQERLARIHDATDQKVSTEQFSEFLQDFPTPEACCLDAFTQTTRVIAASSESWCELQDILEGRTVPALEGSAPHVLELAGLAIRNNGRLEFASPVMERFVVSHYDLCRLGDLHAVHGNWVEAFRLYSGINPSHQVRPNGAADLPRLTLVIKAFIANLHTLATQRGIDERAKLEALKTFFSEGCRLVLGVSEVTYWKYSGGWESQPNQSIDPEVRKLAIGVLDDTDRAQTGWQKVTGPAAKRAACAILPSIHKDKNNAVVVSDSRQTVAISRERGEFLHELLDQFTNAYDHITANWRLSRRLDARQKHLEIATKIVSTIGETIHNPDEALKLAGDELLKLGYRRIMFAVVDPRRERIRGVRFCCGEPPKKDVAKETDWLLQQWKTDIQPWVVHNLKPCLVGDWHQWNQTKKPDQPPINQGLCIDAETAISFAVVPMILRRQQTDRSVYDEVYGTIHVERQDGQLLTDDEIDDLLEFGRQLAAAAHEAERVSALLNALHCDQDSVVIFDDEGLVRFANKTAADRFQIAAGWHEAREAILLSDKSLMSEVRSVIRSSAPLVKHDSNPQAEKGRHEVIFCSPLPDWRMQRYGDNSGSPDDRNVEPTVGAVLNVHDFTDLDRVFATLQRVAKNAVDRESAISALLESVRELGYASVRLYLVDSDCPDNLRSERAIGLSPEYTEMFRNRSFQSNRNDASRGDTWRCLETGQPIVNQWNPSANAPLETKTPRGVTVTNLIRPTFVLPWKKPGDVWIDLPLQARGAPIGKLTVDLGSGFECGLEPKDFELLKVFSALLGGLLAALDREQWIREASERAMADTAHKIGTKLAGLSGFAEDYRRAAPGNEGVAAINAWMEPVVRDCFALVRNVNERVGGRLILERRDVPVREVLAAAAESILAHDCRVDEASYEILCAEGLLFSLDATRCQHAIEAMLDNSRSMRAQEKRVGNPLRIRMRVETFERNQCRWLRLSVADNGPGVQSAHRERIFEPFYSSRPNGRRSTGLGLDYVRRVVQAHGGTIVCVEPSEPGAEFNLEIPDLPKL